jgi:hypothetical protein
MSKEKMVWKKTPTSDDYNGTLNFLSLIFPSSKCDEILQGLRAEASINRSAKDLLRAANLPLLPGDEPHVEEDLKKFHKGKPLAPVLLVRGDLARGVPLIIADGYHRICAACHYDESAPIPCRMVSI